ncbi:YbbR-like domain-containing protein, partial [Hydrogenibacillus schlegelii]
DGYQVLAVRVTPATVRVKGSPEVLAKLKPSRPVRFRSPAPARTSSPRCPATSRRGWRAPPRGQRGGRAATPPPPGRRPARRRWGRGAPALGAEG